MLLRKIHRAANSRLVRSECISNDGFECGRDLCAGRNILRRLSCVGSGECSCRRGSFENLQDVLECVRVHDYLTSWIEAARVEMLDF